MKYVFKKKTFTSTFAFFRVGIIAVVMSERNMKKKKIH